MDCHKCKYADYSTEPRQIETPFGTLVQMPGGTICLHTVSKNITFTDGEKICSAFEEREKEDGKNI